MVDMSKNYLKVMLYAYPRLLGFAEASGVAVENKAALSFLQKGDTLSVAEQIVWEMEFSRLLTELFEEMGVLLAEFSAEERLLLEYKYFRRKKVLKELLKGGWTCSKRNYFRKQNALLRKVAELFTLRGWTEAWFMENFSRSSHFMRALKRVSEGKDRAIKRTSQKSSSSFRVEGERFPRRAKRAITAAERASATRTNTVDAELSPASTSGAVEGGEGRAVR